MLMTIALAAAAAQATPMTIKDPALFTAQLVEMGYTPQPVEKKGNVVQIPVKLDDRTLVMVMGGCTDNRDCTYLAVLGSFGDVKNPSPAWVAKENVNYDMIKVWLNDTGVLIYSAGAVVETMPRAAFKAWIGLIVDSSNQLADDAIKAGLVK